jgi:hypothetical protein
MSRHALSPTPSVKNYSLLREYIRSLQKHADNAKVSIVRGSGWGEPQLDFTYRGQTTSVTLFIPEQIALISDGVLIIGDVANSVPRVIEHLKKTRA